jgi:phosphate-selective porin OprO/OprP
MKKTINTGLLSACVLIWPLAAHAQEDNQANTPDGVRFVMRSNPSLRFGRVLRVDFKARIQSDWQGFSPHLRTDEGAFDLHRARFGIEGNVLNHLEYEVEHEFRENFGGDPIDKRWRDAFVNFRYLRDAQIRLGRFKIPFGREQLTGTMNLDFIDRSHLSESLTPARDSGIMVHGRLFERGFSYQAGVFRHDGDNARPRDSFDALGERTYAMRLTGTPLRLLPVPRTARNVEFGVAVTSNRVPEGLSSLRGKTYAGFTFFPHLFTRGRRTRAGAELYWTDGPFSIKGEFVDVHEARQGQSIRETDLPAVVSRAWYMAGTWVLTGEEKQDRVEPRKIFPSDGIGALEIATRLEQIRFGSSEHPGTPFRSTRAANILGNSNRAWTVGLNWYPNRYVKVQINSVREKIEDPERTPIADRQIFWTGMIRLQFSL